AFSQVGAGEWRFDGSVWSSGWLTPAPPRGLKGLVNYQGSLIGYGPADSLYPGFLGQIDGGEWRSVGPGLRPDPIGNWTWSVARVASNGTSLFVSGSFAQDSPEPLSRVARWTGDHWAALGGGPAPQSVASMLADGEGVVIGGSFPASSGLGNVARWEAGGWSPMGDGWPGVPAESLGRWAGAVVAGGGGRIGVWDGTQWIELTSTVAGGLVRDLLEYNGDLIAVGGFTSIDGQPAGGVARWTANGWDFLAGGVNGTVYSACVFAGELYVSGSFSTAGGVSASNYARWDGARGAAVATSGSEILTQTGSPSMVVFNGLLMAARLPLAGSGSVVASFDGNRWLQVDQGANGPIFRLCPMNDRLGVVGSFTMINNVVANGCGEYRLTGSDMVVSPLRADASFDDVGFDGVVGLSATVAASGRWRLQWIQNGVTSGVDRWYGAPGAPLTTYELAFVVRAWPRQTGERLLQMVTDCGVIDVGSVNFSFGGRCSPMDVGRDGGAPGNDGRLDNNDFIAFIDLFFAHDPAADVGNDGGLGADGSFDNNDFVWFINGFFFECP
ncbi:MAG: hypothetical protein K2Q09_04005, partial [Phycisphaerales bacterium]|nr:hypothetical protein [Phycisphaerales bacterium]